MQREFSYPLKIEELNQGEQTYNLSPSKDELAHIREILNVPAVNSFKATLKLKFNKKQNMLKIEGRVAAELGLISVVSLDSFNKKYTTEFSLIYDTKASFEDIYDNNEDINIELPDIVIGGQIDLADIVIEQLALIMEDHPRKEGEEFEAIVEASEEDDKNNPFLALAKLKK